ncbi:deoxyribose-phosphate aldolase [Phycisphaerales bacterium AB-hyl4]|uniref:Deoxyribose-phosphate aldolase n=1 Tax=Natronomicrosphaera hydrolytica TaxID=3242702 RepID=A0ABV4U5P1_9BACT
MTLAATIDHTNLKPEATLADIDRLCDEALAHGFASVCVNGHYAAHVANRLKASPVKACVVVGFPLGAMKAMIKAIEATSACKEGAQEIDFVAHLPHLLAEDSQAAEREYLELTRAVRSVNPDVVVKLIIESAALMKDVDDETAERRIAVACRAAQNAGCDFVKTSTGFHPAGGATAEAVRLMKQHAGPMQVKASGGIRNADDAHTMLNAGATRLGCSAGVAIVQGQPTPDTGY